MTFEDEFSQVGRAAAGLLLESDRVPASALQAAGTAQVAVYTLLSQVHRGVAPTGLNRSATIHAVLRHPVAALGRILSETVRTRRPAASTFGVLTSSTRSRPDALWRALLRHASLAAVDWHQRTSTPEGDAAWSLIGDVAALGEAASILDADIAAALRSAGRHGETDELVNGPAQHMRLASAQSAALAARGAMPPITVLPGRASRPVLVASAASVSEGQHRLADFLCQAEDVTPHSLLAVTALAGQSARLAARLTPSAVLTASLEQHARHLALAARPPARCATVRPGDPRPEAQAYELRRHLRSLEPGTPAASEAAEAFAGHLQTVTEALTDCARRQTGQGRWLISAADSGPAIWQRSRLGVENGPPFVDALKRVAAEAATDERLNAAEARVVTDAARAFVPPRVTLASPLRAVGAPSGRPVNPSQQPRSGRGR